MAKSVAADKEVVGLVSHPRERFSELGMVHKQKYQDLRLAMKRNARRPGAVSPTAPETVPEPSRNPCPTQDVDFAIAHLLVNQLMFQQQMHVEACRREVFSIYVDRAHMPVRSHPSHCCALCGSKKHNVVRCPFPSADEFRKLRQFVTSLMKQQPMKRCKPKLGVKLSNKRGKVKKSEDMYGTLRKRTVAASFVGQVQATAESA